MQKAKISVPLFSWTTCKTKFTTVLLLIVVSTGYGQQAEKSFRQKNTLYLELLGNAGYLYNITYDRILFSKNKNNFSLGLGAQYFPASDLSNNEIAGVSPQISFWRGDKHCIETGIGFTVDFISGDLAVPLRIGYRYQKPEGGLFYKIGFTPLITKSNPIFGSNLSIVPWGGIAAGWTF